MQIDFLNIILTISITIWLFSLGYLLFALLAIKIFKNNKDKQILTENFQPPVTILKPIYGLDPEILENLRSFCVQDYPFYQVIFGLQDLNDPALPIVEKIIKEFGESDVSLVVSTELHGTNHKVSNLINMYPKTKYNYILIADSDMNVPNDFLSQVMHPFNDSNIGAVTCLYSGTAKNKIVSSLNAMFINHWFLPSVLISWVLQPIKYCFGATMIVRRDILNKIGGFKALSNHLADDYILGKLISNLGYNIYLSNLIIENIIEETSTKSLILHELRWARTLRRIEPLGYMLTFLTDSFVLSIIAGALIFLVTKNFFLLILTILITLVLRVFLHKSSNMLIDAKQAPSVWLIPLRDVLSFFIRIISYTGNTVKWRKNIFSVDHLGIIHEKKITTHNTKNTKKTTDLLTP